MRGCSRGACMVAPGGMHGCSGGHACLLWGGCAWLLRGGMRGCSGGMHGCSGGACMVAPGGSAWDMTRYGDMINERAIHILLECILVFLASV